MANTGFKGVDVRQTGNQLVFRAFLQSSAGALVTTGTTTVKLYELQSDGTLKSYDFNDNTFKTTALTTETLALTHRQGNNSTTNTGCWTAALSTLTGFTIGAIYLALANNTNASPTDQMREFQYGGDQGDLLVTAGSTGQAYLQGDTEKWLAGTIPAPNVTGIPKVDTVDWLGTAVTAATAGIPDCNVKNYNNQAAATDANNLPKVDVEDWAAAAVAAPAVAGVPKVDAFKWLGGTIPAVNVTGVPKVDLVDVLGTAPTATTAGILDVNAKNIANAAAAVDVNNLLKVDCEDWKGNAVPSPDTSGCPKLGNYDSLLLPNGTGTATAGGASSITLQTAIGADSRPLGCVIKLVSGTGQGQARGITAYVDSTKVVTVDRPWATQPDGSTQYAIYAADAAALNASLQVTAGTVADKAGYSLTQTFPTNFGVLSIDGSGRIDLAKWIGVAPNALNNGCVQADVERWLNVVVNALVSGNVPAQAAAYASGQDPATLVLDVAASGHNTAGTIGAKINAAGGAADPLANAVPGSYLAGTAGYVLGNGVKLTAAALDAIVVETGLNARQALSIIAAVCAGVLAGAGGAQITIAAAGVPATNRVTASVDTAGDRTAVTLAPPA